jgi:hypothetical protein
MQAGAQIKRGQIQTRMFPKGLSKKFVNMLFEKMYKFYF